VSLDPGLAAIIEALNTNFPRVEEMDAADVRRIIRGRLQLPPEPEAVGSVEDRHVDGTGGPIPVRIYRPTSTPTAVVVFAHGGGFVFCDLDTHDTLCRSMTNGVGAVVISVDYRLAPENPWPAGAEDVYAVAQWASTQDFGADKLVVAGDSAGGNLAAVTALMARDRGGPPIAAQVLLYPVTDADFDRPSYSTYATGYYQTAAAMKWYWNQYLPAGATPDHPYVCPLRADLRGLPPAVVVTNGCDVLRDEGECFVEALRAAGVPTVHRPYEGGIHGFMTMPGIELGARARQRCWEDIRSVLDSGCSSVAP